jgi:hypothetical protein
LLRQPDDEEALVTHDDNVVPFLPARIERAAGSMEGLLLNLRRQRGELAVMLDRLAASLAEVDDPAMRKLADEADRLAQALDLAEAELDQLAQRLRNAADDGPDTA